MPILFEQPTEAKYAYKFRKESKFSSELNNTRERNNRKNNK